MSAGVYGFYKNKTLKVSGYSREANPKKLGYLLFKTLYNLTDWPQELSSIFDKLILVDANVKPTDLQFEDMELEISNKNFYDLLNEQQNDIVYLFMSIKHSRVKYFVDGKENLKVWGICDWVYIYNLDSNSLEIYYKKILKPTSYIELSDLDLNFDLIHSINLDDQIDLAGLDFAYDKIYKEILK